ncbi:RNA-binding domain-containing [Pyrrhoderma noxium]|uniref:RNA-binding domain-containing n=1 Tax=Pyrrhoderma noxium TaxID=2282107 RepID=A0A286U6N4_9AGAM|nr:RNA-binding domain-containing [Pyrrhoderma noxium]
MARSAGFRSKKPYERSAGPRGSDGMWVHDLHDKNVPPAVVNANRKPQSEDSANNKLLVSNLHYEVTENDLITIFGQVGTLIREPFIKYDKSGRSTGEAVITFEKPVDASKALEQFDGILAKGQEMSIKYDTFVPKRAPRVNVQLRDRIAKPSLISRLSGDVDAALESKEDSKPSPRFDDGGVGPTRTRARRGKGRRHGERFKKEPKTAADLDKELEAYLEDDNNVSVNVTAAVAPAPTVITSTKNEDVEMEV